MLEIIVPGEEHFDEKTQKFFTVGDVSLELEHSLVSLSKWESDFQKPFLGSEEKTSEEVVAYIKHMIVTENYDENIINKFDQDILDQINNYIESPQSATTFGNMPERKGRGETITSELVYYWMVAFTIPFECQYWHLNRLFSLVRICNLKNSKQKKMSRTEIAQRNRDLNERRKSELGTRG